LNVTASTSGKLITVIGGSGFLGRHIVRALAKRGYRIRVACRRPDLAGHVQPLGTPGQIMPVQANVRYPASLAAACDGAYAVINLTGILYGSGAQSFDAVPVFGAEASAKAAQAAKARSSFQVSAIGADAASASNMPDQGAERRVRARAAFPGAMSSALHRVRAGGRLLQQIRRPGAPFSRPAADRRRPPQNSTGVRGRYRRAVARLVDAGEADRPLPMNCGGPEVLVSKQLMQFTPRPSGRKRLLMPLPWAIAKMQGMILGLLPKPLLTADQVELLRSDNVVSEDARRDRRDFEGLGITPRGIAGIVPAYLYRYRRAGQFTPPRGTPE
jgi:NADH dehydrogenase